jgi:Arc/MetJ-type ribon-helix-helix transcriptional regulator
MRHGEGLGGWYDLSQGTHAMPRTSTLRVSLSEQSLEYVQRKVASGEYASESDALDDMVAARRDEDAELERWLKEVVADRYESYLANPSSTVPIDQVEQHPEERKRKRAEAG